MVILDQKIEKFDIISLETFTRLFNKALPKPYICLLYNGRVKLYFNVFCQLCSGLNWYNKYLAKINVIEIKQYKFG